LFQIISARLKSGSLTLFITNPVQQPIAPMHTHTATTETFLTVYRFIMRVGYNDMTAFTYYGNHLTVLLDKRGLFPLLFTTLETCHNWQTLRQIAFSFIP